MVLFMTFMKYVYSSDNKQLYFMHFHSVFYVYIIHDPAVIIRVLLTYEPTSRLKVT